MGLQNYNDTPVPGVKHLYKLYIEYFKMLVLQTFKNLLVKLQPVC